MVRADKSEEHPLYVGPTFIHRDANFEAYNYFFSTIKASLCCEHAVESFEVRLEKYMHIGSDEELALTKDIDFNFPASIRFLCTKHLRDGTLAHLETKVGVPQKERNEICRSIFGDDGLVNANDSIDFDEKSKDAIAQSCRYGKFLNNFSRKLQPSIEAYVNGPNRGIGDIKVDK